MGRTLKLTASLALVGVTALSISACATSSSKAGSAGAASTAKAETQTVRIVQGGGDDFSNAPIYKAIDLMKAQGLTVRLDTVEDPANALRAVIAGKDDIYLGAPVEAATAVANGGADLKYIASTAGASSYVLLARPGFELNNLDGAKFATAGPGSAGDIIATAALTKSGVDVKKIRKVTVGGTSARVTAILSGQVDLAPVLSPAAVPAVATGKVKILLNTGAVLGPYLQQGLIARGDFVTNNKTTVQTVVSAFIDGARFSVADEAGYIAVANAAKMRGTLNDAEEKAAWEQLKEANFFAVNGAICPQSVTTTLEYEYQTPGGLTKESTPKYSDWIDPTFVAAYLKSKGDDPNAC